MIVFACLSPHPPIILPSVGSAQDREKVKKTISSLEKLGKELAKTKPDCLVITSPHPDWGFNVPLHFLLPKSFPSQGVVSSTPLRWKAISSMTRNKVLTKGEVLIDTSGKGGIFPFLTNLESPQKHFQWGQEIATSLPPIKRLAWVASGDMSHCLKEDGPYGFHPSGPKFDQEFIRLLKKKDIAGILNLDSRLIEEAGECGLRSFCMLLGALDWQASLAGLEPRSAGKSSLAWQPEILSYEAPFGVGYLVANLKIKP